MIFFGRGKKSKSRDLQDGQHELTAVWSYFHFFRCPVGLGTKRYIIGNVRSEDRQISYSEVKQIFPNETPKVSLWHRYGLLLVIGGFALTVIIPVLASMLMQAISR